MMKRVLALLCALCLLFSLLPAALAEDADDVAEPELTED